MYYCVILYQSLETLYAYSGANLHQCTSVTKVQIRVSTMHPCKICEECRLPISVQSTYFMRFLCLGFFKHNIKSICHFLQRRCWWNCDEDCAISTLQNFWVWLIKNVPDYCGYRTWKDKRCTPCYNNTKLTDGRVLTVLIYWFFTYVPYAQAATSWNFQSFN